jgi:hypothetical protein
LNLQDLQVEIRPRTAGETISLAARMLQHRPGPVLSSALLMTAGVVGTGLLLFVGLGLHWFFTICLVLLLAPAFSLPLYATVGHLVFSRRVTLSTVARITLRRSAAFLMLFFWQRVLVLLGLVAAIYPGLLMWRNGMFLGPIIALEGSSVATSRRRGRQFGAGYGGLVARHALNGTVLLLYLTVSLATLVGFLAVKVFGITFSWLALLPQLDGYYTVLTLVGLGLSTPFLALVWFFVYLDVRIRKEGWDLEISFRTRAALLERRRAA